MTYKIHIFLEFSKLSQKPPTLQENDLMVL